MNNSAFNDPQFLAGLAMARGVAPDQAIEQSALFQRQQEDALRKQIEFENQQYMQQMLPQIIGGLQNIESPIGKLQALVNAGIPPQDAALLMERLGIAATQKMSNSNQEPGVINNIAKPLNATELRNNLTILKEANKTAQNAERELRLLEDSAGAFKQFDESTGDYTGAGSALSKIPLPKIAENILFDEQAQIAKQKIDKLNSQLFQNRVAGLGARATDAAKAEILKGLPQINLTKEARADLLNTKKRENYEAILRSRFFNEWAKANNNDLTGAENEFSAFIDQNQDKLLTSEGNPNKKLLDDLTNIAKGGQAPARKNTLEDYVGKVTPEQVRAAIAKKLAMQGK